MDKLSPNPVQIFLRNKYTVLTMGGTAALGSPIPTFYDWRATDLQLRSWVTACVPSCSEAITDEQTP